MLWLGLFGTSWRREGVVGVSTVGDTSKKSSAGISRSQRGMSAFSMAHASGDVSIPRRNPHWAEAHLKSLSGKEHLHVRLVRQTQVLLH